MEGILTELRRSIDDWWLSFLHEVPPFSFRLVEAILLLLIVRILLGRFRSFLRRWLSRTRADEHTAFLLDRTLTWLIWGAAGIWTLTVLGFDLTAIAASLGLVTLALTIALQDVFRNIFAGLYLLLERPYQLGQRIKVKDVEGIVEQIRLRVTVLRKDDGALAFVPNGILFAEIILNRGPVQAIVQTDQNEVETGAPQRPTRA